MEIIISNSSDKPIYEQIAMQIKSLIMNGTLSAGEALPSMRALAKDLHISVITVQRAYEDLTRNGFIETVVDLHQRFRSEKHRNQIRVPAP